MSLGDKVKQLANDVINSRNFTEVKYGIVKDSSPTIQIEKQKEALTKEFFTVPKHLKACSGARWGECSSRTMGNCGNSICDTAICCPFDPLKKGDKVILLKQMSEVAGSTHYLVIGKV